MSKPQTQMEPMEFQLYKTNPFPNIVQAERDTKKINCTIQLTLKIKFLPLQRDNFYCPLL